MATKEHPLVHMEVCGCRRLPSATRYDPRPVSSCRTIQRAPSPTPPEFPLAPKQTHTRLRVKLPARPPTRRILCRRNHGRNDRINFTSATQAKASGAAGGGGAAYYAAAPLPHGGNDPWFQ
ncbi:hypothetical protein VOLCADRAFT_92256 [Volvox carteri f. nagariensis]|uniref:Uncharacterized protein n=1 Tax=Volvox carteri f. nagariensis TaxID=3068 RepID=D8TZ65_VOLCA|nr:uncharacterized protein VOLCADRAFT_92256 [Volvox carteri f. nagariensis]EFJ47126.1 hypothetical protein VOLCADRAFT_92256 [Volvox carteri f. nagariensis]|eukprot:XP_002951675.1 hypothetical protein VOLCADRAFT_92256 [Volvox carteri f. nagariensis]